MDHLLLPTERKPVSSQTTEGHGSLAESTSTHLPSVETCFYLVSTWATILHPITSRIIYSVTLFDPKPLGYFWWQSRLFSVDASMLYRNNWSDLGLEASLQSLHLGDPTTGPGQSLGFKLSLCYWWPIMLYNSDIEVPDECKTMNEEKGN